MALSFKKLMYLAYTQVTGERLVAWCSSPAIMAGPVGESLYMCSTTSCLLLTCSSRCHAPPLLSGWASAVSA